MLILLLAYNLNLIYSCELYRVRCTPYIGYNDGFYGFRVFCIDDIDDLSILSRTRENGIHLIWADSAGTHLTLKCENADPGDMKRSALIINESAGLDWMLPTRAFATTRVAISVAIQLRAAISA